MSLQPVGELNRGRCNVVSVAVEGWYLCGPNPGNGTWWLGHLIQMPPWGRVPGMRPQGRPKTRWRDYISQLDWECSGSPQRHWRTWPGRGSLGFFAWTAAPPQDPVPYERKTIDGWKKQFSCKYCD